MFCHIDSDLFNLAVLQCRLAGQLKATIGGECVFDPFDGATDGTFGAVIVDTDVFHCSVFAVVLQSDEQFVAESEVGRLSTVCVQLIEGGLQDIHHRLEDGFRGSDNAFELCIRQFQGFFSSFHDFSLDSFSKIGYNLEEYSHFRNVRQDQNRNEMGYATSLLLFLITHFFCGVGMLGKAFLLWLRRWDSGAAGLREK